MSFYKLVLPPSLIKLRLARFSNMVDLGSLINIDEPQLEIGFPSIKRLITSSRKTHQVPEPMSAKMEEQNDSSYHRERRIIDNYDNLIERCKTCTLT